MTNLTCGPKNELWSNGPIGHKVIDEMSVYVLTQHVSSKEKKIVKNIFIKVLWCPHIYY